jgi:Prophage tail length tape measure protein
MAVSQATLELLITMKDAASDGISALGSTLGTLGGIAGGAALAGVAALGGAIAAGVGDAKEAAQIMAQTESVITSTGNAAGTSADHVADYAASLSAASGQSLFGDDQIQQSENLLLTFTNIKEKTLDAATAISVDMAQALGGAPKDAAIQLGKALNDPVAGVTALTKVGVTFTDQQKEQIKTMQEAGDTASAQQVILTELNKEFGGSAKAAADADGGMAQFNDRMGEAAESLGSLFLPILADLAGILNDTVMPAIEGLAATLSPLIEAFVNTFSAIAEGEDPVDAISGLFSDLQPILGSELAGTIATIATTVLDMATAFGGLVQTLQEAGPLSGDFGEAIGGVLKTLGLSNETIDVVEKALFGIQNTISTLLIPAFMTVWEVVQTQVMPILSDLGTIVVPLLSAAIDVLGGFFNDVIVPAVKMLWQVLTTLVLPALSVLVAWLKEVLPPIIAVVAGFLTDTLFPAFKTAFEYISTNIIPAFANLKGNLSAFYDYYLQPIVDGFNAVVKAITDADQWLKNITGTLASIAIPDWLEGHSPPPMANWFADIAQAAGMASDQAGAIGFGSGGVPAGALGGGSTSITVGQIVVQGTADPSATALLVRNELLKLGNRNLNIFGGLA